MPSTRLILLVALVIGLTPQSEAGLAALCRRVAAQACVLLEPSLAGGPLEVTLENGSKATLRLGEQINYGATATAYYVENPRDFGIEWEGPVVARIPHSFGILPTTLLNNKTKAPSQGDTYDYLTSRKEDIQSSILFPRAPSWGARSLPIVPVLKKIDSDRGQITFKPLVVGMEVGAIRASYPRGMPPEMTSSLENIYSFGTAVSDRLKVPASLQPTNRPPADIPYALDLVGRNLVWVKVSENPRLAKVMGIERDTFLCYEPDFTTATNRYASFEDYANQFATVTPGYFPWFPPKLPVTNPSSQSPSTR